MGFQIIMAYGGSSLVNSDIKATLQSDITWQVGASYSPEVCNGAYYALELGLGVTISLTNPLPGWGSSQNYTVLPHETVSLVGLTCVPWNTSGSASTRRSVVGGAAEAWAVEGRGSSGSSGSSLSRRGFVDSLFPDGFGSMISCPTDIYTPTGDCNVKVGDYSGDYANEYSGVSARDDAPTDGNEDATPNEPGLAARMLAKRVTNKPQFDFCIKPDIRNQPVGIIAPVRVSKISFHSSGDMLNRKNGYSLATFLSYGPLNPSDCDDYSFGQIATPAASQSLDFASEHVLEWQILKRFLTNSPQLSPLSAAKRANPAASGFKKGQVVVKDPTDQTSTGRGEATWKYCSYMWFWWSTIPGVPQRSYAGLTGSPINLVNQAFPNKKNYVSELQLLSKEANNLKERIWGEGEIRDPNDMRAYITSSKPDDVHKAINYCKQVMFAVKYMQIPAVATLLATQATRVGTYFDDVETLLAQLPKDAAYNSATYQPLGLGNAWRKYVYATHSEANARQSKFLKDWVGELVTTHLGTTSNNAGGGQQSGGVQTNPAIIKRVQALQAAYANFLQTPWANPFPATWA